MDSSRTFIHDEKKLLIHILIPSFLQLAYLEDAILLLHLYIGKKKSLRIESNRLQDMMLLSLNGAILATNCIVVDH